MSYEVHLRRRETKSHLPAPVVANAKKVLSSVFVGGAPLKGLESDEEYIIAGYLGMAPDEKDFPQTVRDFWANVRVNVPMDGKVLNIGMDNNQPYVPIDYIIYKWAKKHPYVASSREEMLDNSRYQYYIHDPEIATAKENEKVELKMKAYKEFILIKDDEDKINRLIRLITDSDPESMSLKQKQNLLSSEIDIDPKKFFITVTDKNLETKAIISELVSENIVTKIGNQHYFIDQKLGDTLEEAVLFFNDKKRSDVVTLLKAKLQQSKE